HFASNSCRRCGHERRPLSSPPRPADHNLQIVRSGDYWVGWSTVDGAHVTNLVIYLRDDQLEADDAQQFREIIEPWIREAS
ncbi:MAG TPA: hypothetical protein VG672_26895, partial [Bryobacteraceae bacterium]|nr:hypothetical protein [Bryobacteraceae bacterium]